MPILPIFYNAAFGPELIELMGDAFDLAMGQLSFVPAKIVQEAMANRIIEAADQGVRDVEQLVDAALTGTGLKHGRFRLRQHPSRSARSP
jgi:hypothetical protein